MEEALLFALVSPHLQALSLPSHGHPFMRTHRPPVIRPVSVSDFIVAGFWSWFSGGSQKPMGYG